MKKLMRGAAALCAVVLGMTGTGIMGAYAADSHTYEELGVDAQAKQEFEEKVAKKHSLPVVSVTTRNNSEWILSREDYTDCVVDVFNGDEKYDMSEVSAGIKVRGNSSSYYGDVNKIKHNPVPYRIKFDKKQNMLGLNDGAKCKSWVLLKTDWNLLMNDAAFRMGRAIFGDTAFVSDSMIVNLYVNDKFQGVYLLCEQSQVNENRVDVTEPEKNYEGTDIGYYLELDNYASSEPEGTWFTMDYEGATVTDVRGTTRKFVPAEYSIKNDIYSEAQSAFIADYLDKTFEILYKAVEKGEYLTFDENFELVKSDYRTAEECVSAVMDMDSLVDMYLLYEIVHDYDCGEGSFYMAVDFAEGARIPKLQFTSPWDFNWAYNDSTSRYWAGAFCEKSFVNSYGDRSNPWFILLAKTDWFHDLCVDRWQDTNSAVKQEIADEYTYLATYETDLTRQNQVNNGAGDIYSAKNLLGWIEKRLKWMDKTFAPPEGTVALKGSVINGVDGDGNDIPLEGAAITLVKSNGGFTRIDTRGSAFRSYVAPGNYTMVVSKSGCVSREYPITVGDKGLEQKAEIHLKGDIDGDGKVSASDIAAAASHTKALKLLSGYELKCGDIDGNGDIGSQDVTALSSHVKGVKLIG